MGAFQKEHQRWGLQLWGDGQRFLKKRAASKMTPSNASVDVQVLCTGRRVLRRLRQKTATAATEVSTEATSSSNDANKKSDEEDFLDKPRITCIVSMLGKMGMHVTNIDTAEIALRMATAKSALHFLNMVNFGGITKQSLVRFLASSACQMIGLCAGELPIVGSGAWKYAWALSGIECSEKHPNMTLVLPCMIALLPVMAWLVEYTLGPSWVQFVCYRTIQGYLYYLHAPIARFTCC